MGIFSFLRRDYNLDFVKYNKLAMVLFAVLSCAAIAVLATKPLNYGIDFRGGLLIEVRSVAGFDVERVRSSLGQVVSDFDLQTIGEGTNDLMIRALDMSESEEMQTETLEKIRGVLGYNIEYRRVEMVGPKVGEELKFNSMLAASFSILAIALYIWFRFEWQFALGAMVSLTFNVLMTLSLIVMRGITFDLTTVAAILTVVGYSINDTIVLYDRLRENLHKHRKMAMPSLINKSINENIVRTILTGATTLAACASLLWVGGPALHPFAFTLFVGVLIGVYSSIYVAVPVAALFDIKKTMENKEG